jgi:hypothetical protein
MTGWKHLLVLSGVIAATVAGAALYPATSASAAPAKEREAVVSPQSLTQGFDIYNMSSQDLRVSPVSHDEYAGPKKGDILKPGQKQHFEIVYMFARSTAVSVYYFPTDPNGVGYVRATLWVNDINQPSTQIIDQTDALRLTGGRNTVAITDPPGTVKDIPASQGQAQAEVLRQLCIQSSAAQCSFDVTSERRTQSDRRLISHVVYNDNDVPTESRYTEGDIYQTTNSIGLELRVSTSLFDIVEAEITARYEHSWTQEHHFEQDVLIPLPAHTKGWVEGTDPIIRDTGDFTVTMGSTTWHLRGVYFDSPDPKGRCEWHIKVVPLNASEPQAVGGHEAT